MKEPVSGDRARELLYDAEVILRMVSDELDDLRSRLVVHSSQVSNPPQGNRSNVRLIGV